MKKPRFLLMRWMACALAILMTGGPAAAQFSGDPGFNPDRLKTLNSTISDAVGRKEVPGAVVWLERNGKRWGNAYGSRAVDPAVRPMAVDTIFDAASLTKVMATAPAIMLLVEDGVLNLDDPASRWIPEFTGGGKEKITLRQMMTHVSGLKPGIGGGTWTGYAAGVAKAAAEPVQSAPNTEFRYSDLNFILLGEVVHRASGIPLDQFVSKRIFVPLSMEDTGYMPPAMKRDRIAPTTREGDVVIQGVVHDPTARRMGGVAGHAGLFTNARDVARYCRMLLNKGMSPDKRVILKPETVRQMIAVQPPLPAGVLRTLGFDVLSGYSDPKGAHFGPESFGHTGWTGGCFWIDPAADSFYVLMTNRNHPVEGRGLKNLRWQVASLAAEAMGVAKTAKSGADEVSANGLKLLEGKKIGLITNHTGRTSDGKTTLEAIQKIPGAKVVRLFGPEHGIAGKLDQEGITDSTDPASGLPVTSLYGAERKPSAESLKDVEVLVFDIQDVGARFYTYMSTMLNCMESAAAAKLPFVVLDRVNPVGGIAVEGPLPVDVKNTFVACHSLPVQHGLTIGELARLFVKERLPGLQLTVVPVKDWERRLVFERTMAPWVNPSPNLHSPEAAMLYPGVALLEMTNVSVGRGTDLPFHLVGAPWVDGKKLAERLTAEGVPGVRVEEAEFKPVSSTCKGETCHGVRLGVYDTRQIHPVRLGVLMAKILFEEHPDKFPLDKVNTLLFHPATLQAIRDKKSIKEITALWQADEADFRKRCADILLYAE